MRQIRHNDPFHISFLRHNPTTLTFLHHKLKPPKPILMQAKSPTHRRSLRITEKPKILREERIIHIQGAVAEFPQWEIRMTIRGRKAQLQIRRYPSFIIIEPEFTTEQS